MLRLHRKPPKKLKKKHLLRESSPGSSKKKNRPVNENRKTKLKKVEKRIEELETRDKEIDDTLVLPDVCTNVGRCAELSREKDKIQAELEELYEKWRNLRNCNFLSHITGATVSQLIQWLFCAYIKSFFPEIL